MANGSDVSQAVGSGIVPRWLWFGAALLLCLDIWLVAHDALFHAAVLERMSAARTFGLPFDVAERSVNDPTLGSALPSVGAGRDIRKAEPRSDAGYVLIMLSSCTSCTKLDVRRWVADTRAAGARLLLASASPTADIAVFRKGIGVAMPLYHDPQGALHDSLNAWWNGRIYYFDRGWRLRWLASFTESDRRMESLDGLRAALRSPSTSWRAKPGLVTRTHR